MEKFRNSLGKLTVAAGEAAVGVVLLVNPEGFTKLILIAAGILLCILGALSCVTYFRMEPAEAALSQELVRGLVGLVAGVLLIYKADWIIHHLMPITILYGIAALFTGIVKLQWTVDMARLRQGVWQSSAIASALSVILAVVILSDPFSARRTLWIFTGVTLIVTAVATVLSAFLNTRKKHQDIS